MLKIREIIKTRKEKKSKKISDLIDSRKLKSFDVDVRELRELTVSMLESSNLSLYSLTLPCPKCGAKEVREIEPEERKKKGQVKRFLCLNCGRKFVENYPIATDYNLDVLATILGLVSSLRRPTTIVYELKKIGVECSKPTIYNLSRKCVGILMEFESIVLDFDPNYLVIDDSVEVVNRNTLWVTNVIECETRFWLASHVSSNREYTSSKAALLYARNLLSNLLKFIKCDGFKGHVKAIGEVFPGVKIISTPKTENYGIVNEIESVHSWMRMNLPKKGAFRSWGNLNTFLQLLRFRHNFFRRIGGATPAQRAGIPFKPEFGWKSLLQMAIWVFAEYRAREKRPSYT